MNHIYKTTYNARGWLGVQCVQTGEQMTDKWGRTYVPFEALFAFTGKGGTKMIAASSYWDGTLETGIHEVKQVGV